MKTLKLPEGFDVLESQVAGHRIDLNGGQFGLLVEFESKCVLKPMGKMLTGKRELDFYESLKSSNRKYDYFKALVPKFYNILEMDVYGKKLTFLKLENVTLSMILPCVMDIKIGRQTWDPLATPKKRSMEEEKYSKCKQHLGFCIPGFQVYSLDSGKLLRYGKDFGKQLHPDNVQEVLKTFFNTQKISYPPLIRRIIAYLKNIEGCFKQQTAFKFYASSILIAYDCQMLSTKGTCSSLVNITEGSDKQCFPEHHLNDESTDTTKWIKVKMIDFAHVFENEDESIDSNYLFGLQNLISLTSNLLPV